MRVLLVYPNVRGMNMLPPALALFSSILKRKGHEVNLFDSTDYPNPEAEDFDSDKTKETFLNARPFDDSLLKKYYIEVDVYDAFEKCVRSFNPDLIVVSCTEDMFPLASSLLERIAPLRILNIVGGVFPTFAPELVLSYPQIDMVCVGEGEMVLAELTDRLRTGASYTNISGLWVKQEGAIVRNSPAPPIDINTNPPLDLSIFSESRFYRPMEGRLRRMFPLETHRGCPYTCTYCNSPSQRALYKKETSANFFRKKSLEKIREEIILFTDQYHAESLYFWADTFFAYSDKEFDQFVEMYSEFKVPFWCQTRPELITSERLEKLASVGLFRIALGIEHGNEEFRKRMLKRNISNDLIIRSLNLIHESKISFSVNNIIGFPYETRALTFDTIELNRQITGADGINAYSFSPFHGTPLREIAEKEGYVKPGLIARSATKPTLLKMPQYPPEQIEGMRRCFVLYVKMPKDRWPEIERAEKLTPEGNELCTQLLHECSEKYCSFNQ